MLWLVIFQHIIFGYKLCIDVNISSFTLFYRFIDNNYSTKNWMLSFLTKIKTPKSHFLNIISMFIFMWLEWYKTVRLYYWLMLTASVNKNERKLSIRVFAFTIVKLRVRLKDIYYILYEKNIKFNALRCLFF